MLISICNQIINRYGEEIVDTNGAGHVLNGMCDMHRQSLSTKNACLKTNPSLTSL